MVKILSFVGDVLQVEYKTFEEKLPKFARAKIETDQSDETDGGPALVYMCNVLLKEVGRGLSFSKQSHIVNIQMSKEAWTAKVIDKGDRIEILDNASWRADKPVIYRVYDKAKLAQMDKSFLRKDVMGRTYGERRYNPYSVWCKPNQWKLVCKYSDLYYCTVAHSGIKLPLESRKQFNKNSTLEFYLDDDEMKVFDRENGKVVQVMAYSNKIKFGTKYMQIYTEYNEEDESNFLRLTEVDLETHGEANEDKS